MYGYHDIFFDLDGTLTDPGLGITNSVMHALRHYGITVTDRRELYPYIGPPLMESFQEFCGFSETRAREAVGYYREYFTDRGIFENEVYPGIPALLSRLQKAGLRLVVATSKPEPFARRILDHFGLTPYFREIVGATEDETLTEKWEVIESALARCGNPARGGVLMIGDRKYDVRGAKRCGLACMGVLYGYGSRAELEDAGADLFAETPAQIAAQLLTETESEL